ncbi:probable apyrase 7 [Olea europaea subsp. europaea]|uniref:Probable apyrase 7 n=1 Tax=Olea europaea subsp. europaea TaxID=158383 RepID=A0A8S0TG00_OLEEU|nr:probable apyrase 7 [Olea europaea subsp. europaea]
MVFSKFAEIVSSATARLSTPKSFALSNKLLVFLLVRGSSCGYTISSPENKTGLRLSSSLQDLSTYRRLDPEASDLSPRIERCSSYTISSNLLQNENGGLNFSKEKTSLVIPSRQKKWVRVICLSKFYIVLDCGSTGTHVYIYQVTFEGKEVAHNKTSLKLRIVLVYHHLTAYSLLGYGLNDAFNKSVAHLLRRCPDITNADLVSGNVKMMHPWLHYGYKEQYTCSHCAFVYEEGRSPARGDILGKSAKVGVPVRLVGTPNWQQCNVLAKVAVNLSEWSDHSPSIDCELQPCALVDNLPRPFGQFYAMFGFYVVYYFSNLTPNVALDDILEKGDGRVKTPSSSTIADTQRRPFYTGPSFSSSGIQHTESSFYSLSNCVAHSFSSSNLGRMQFDNGNVVPSGHPTEVRCVCKVGDPNLEKTLIRHLLRHTRQRFKAASLSGLKKIT